MMQDTNPAELDADVIVVGGGPVGTTTALKLARGGMRVIVLEAREANLLEGRATTFHPPTLEMLESIGLTDELVRRGLRAPYYQFRDAKLGKIVELDFGVLHEDTRYPYRLQLEQSHLTQLAVEALEAHPLADFRTGSRVESVAQLSGCVEVHVDSGEILRARHVIAADGMRSVVRTGLGLGFSGHTYPERYLVLSTNLPLHEILDDLAAVNYVADPESWHVLLRNPAGWRILFPAPPSAGTDEEVLGDDHVRRELRRVLPEADLPDLERVTLYEVHRKVAERFRVGDIFLAGDAAHVNNPLGGMGMNSGIHDGMLLAEILLAGADSDALDRWAESRRAVALEFVGEETEGNWEALREDDEERRAQKREEWRALEADQTAQREFLLRSSMLASLK
ncbi:MULTISPECIES: FAD-dependent oxidoreductase [unclassified Rhodococcus (in: high G+C Gram-positive bacteria)]|uniref:FAD-dependent oxidoreductase n=1 Tax=unclassified Rhodococcus (in: high G+C Gram-positive bacteria) TaxID=192944 RepID=UPI00233F586B|nr:MULTISPECIES: NAD(P)/FAD-dependent oxidoreductase [unclassified Rhodococcus (in: high G+C Gram-positive bacteria)]MDC3729288.1 FAD-dependent monooxygenase [Rhodococcus sp. Rp3]WSE24171.1 NAD(P)/FAD-dependent oxidoreductase [Rhodococcus sp. PD04]